jgi:uncharacterized lipoprotein YmbA
VTRFALSREPLRTLSAATLTTTLMAALLAGCASPPTTFYTLSPDASLQREGGALPHPVVVGPVTIPEVVDRPQIVTRTASAQVNQVTFGEFDRWGESLKSGIADTLAADLGRLLGPERVSVAARAVADQDAWRVRVDVMQFDSVPGDAVTIEAQWSVRGPDSTLASGRSLVREPVQGAGYQALVAAHSRALAAISREIAAAIARSAPA